MQTNKENSKPENSPSAGAKPRLPKGTKVRVYHARQGEFDGIITKDFDASKDEWVSVAVDQDEPVEGLSTIWERGDEVPTRWPVRIVLREA